jgi:hypothetical protein
MVVGFFCNFAQKILEIVVETLNENKTTNRMGPTYAISDYHH